MALIASDRLDGRQLGRKANIESVVGSVSDEEWLDVSLREVYILAGSNFADFTLVKC